MEAVAFLAGLLVFGLIKLFLVLVLTRHDGADAVRGTGRGEELRAKALEAKVEVLEAPLKPVGGDAGEG